MWLDQFNMVYEFPCMLDTRNLMHHSLDTYIVCLTCKYQLLVFEFPPTMASYMVTAKCQVIYLNS